MTITTDCACQNFSEMQETIEELRAQLAAAKARLSTHPWTYSQGYEVAKKDAEAALLVAFSPVIVMRADFVALAEELAECEKFRRARAGVADPAALVASQAELVDALTALRRVSFHRSRCPAFPPGCVGEPCDCGYDDAEELALTAIARARAARGDAK